MSLKTQVQEVKQAVMNALTLDETFDTDILDTLKKEHDEVKDLLASLQDANSAAERHGLVRQISAALIPHSVAEEKVVYETVLALTDNQAHVDGYEGFLEHELASRTLGRLAAIDNATSPEHRATAKVLKELVEHHINEEEGNIWRDVKKLCSSDDRARMNTLYKAEKSRARVTSVG